ncbi:MAG: GNAT family N-acetyltransferase [Nitrososphaerales archaeon]|jgi:RimJ/RimL family protein N-acetyltransferase
MGRKEPAPDGLRRRRSTPLSSTVIRSLPSNRWDDYRNLRLESLKSDPSAFGTSFEEEEILTEAEWKRRMKNVLFAVSEDMSVGMIGYLFNERVKKKHIAELIGVYVTANHRGEGIGTKMLESALSSIRKNKAIVKVQLLVNPEQRAAVNVYEKFGFVVIGVLKKELKVGRKFYDVLFMEKML